MKIKKFDVKKAFIDYQKNAYFIDVEYPKRKNEILEKYSGISSIDYSKERIDPDYYNNSRLNNFSDELEELNKKLELAEESNFAAEVILKELFIQRDDDEEYMMKDIIYSKYLKNESINDCLAEYDFPFEERTAYKKINTIFSRLDKVWNSDNYQLKKMSSSSEKLKYIRENILAISQTEMAEDFRISREHYHRMEKGDSRLNKKLLKLIDFYELE